MFMCCDMRRFIVPKHIQQAFVAAWRQREADMQGQPGFMGFNVISDGENYTVSSRWAR
jgi:heme-degrading monooxygenase HmoA